MTRSRKDARKLAENAGLEFRYRGDTHGFDVSIEAPNGRQFADLATHEIVLWRHVREAPDWPSICNKIQHAISTLVPCAADCDCGHCEREAA